MLGTGAVHPTAPYKWLKGHRPRREEVRQATALQRLPHVHSPHCLVRLRRLADVLRARKTNSHVREFSTELDRRLKLVA